MQNVLLVTVTRVEAEAVLDLFSKASGVPWKRHLIDDKIYYDLGEICGVNVYMVQSEMGAIGPGAALITIHKAIEALTPTCCIMVGIAFGINSDKQHLGEVLVSQKLQAYEPQKITGSGKIIARGDRVTASSRLLDKFRSGDMDWNGAKVHFGLILSGEILVDNKKFRDGLLALAPEAIGGEMEGAGLYAAANESKVDWILVKAICDWADGNKSYKFQKKAAYNATSFTLHVIQQGGLAVSKSVHASIVTNGSILGNQSSQSIELEKPNQCNFIFKGREYVFIPAGPFVMGSSDDRIKEITRFEQRDMFNLEVPRHKVELNGYFISRYPVTNAEYKAFVQATRHAVPFRDDIFSKPYNWDANTCTFPEGRENHPVVLVSWFDAQAYCAWIGGRLPSEAEWEKAARGNDGYEWPWGNTWQEDRCNAMELGLGETTPVDSFSPRGDSLYGVGDMAGNVWEWCSSLCDPYPYRADDGRESLKLLGRRVIRGGSWDLGRWITRCASRGSEKPDEYGFSIGFRIVFDSPPKD
jgi:formylglycine-generating enzyme required for sulfatase activity/nucleoside phosphorylase